MKKDAKNIAVIGLGYVGLPLYCLLSKYFTCIGLDKDSDRIAQLNAGIDCKECEELHNIRQALQQGKLTSSYSDLAECDVFVVCIPTGVDKYNRPDLGTLKDVCQSIGKVLKHNNIVIFESTVFPGANPFAQS